VTTIRRIYAYLLAFAGLAMVSIAMANLVQLLVDLVLQVPVVSSDRYVRDTVSLYAAAALVGLPVWLVHWLWIGRSVRADPEERASTLRRLYVYAVLVGAGVRYEGRRLLPDVDERCEEVAGAITPRVGGVGPTTIAMLFRNAIEAAERRGA